MDPERLIKIHFTALKLPTSTTTIYTNYILYTALGFKILLLFFDLLTTILPSSRESYDSLETLIGDKEAVECTEHVDILHMFTEGTTKRIIIMLIARRTHFFYRTINIYFTSDRHKKEQEENAI
uniref:Uncharacterized protein n=1 Tax=Glossina pallidipes TaxID=7398 RepID=A0A1A9ZY59_GLOPL